jgi:hypothetical protein
MTLARMCPDPQGITVDPRDDHPLPHAGALYTLGKVRPVGVTGSFQRSR